MQKLLVLAASVLLLGGCGSLDFNPFDYRTREDAKVGLGSENYKLRLRGKRLVFEKKLVPKELKKAPRTPTNP